MSEWHAATRVASSGLCRHQPQSIRREKPAKAATRVVFGRAQGRSSGTGAGTRLESIFHALRYQGVDDEATFLLRENFLLRVLGVPSDRAVKAEREAAREAARSVIVS